MRVYELVVEPGREEHIARHHVSVTEVEDVVFSIMTTREQCARQTKSRLPTFKTIEEEAAFWDSHDSVEFEDEFEPVTDVRFVPRHRKKSVTVRLDEDALADLARRAREKGVSSSALARTWILDRLQRPEPSS